jgi:hypothetical protein
MCCDHGRVQLPQLLLFPPILSNLVSRAHRNHFLRYARAYNSALQLESTSRDTSIKQEGGIKHFFVQGKIYHSMRSLRPANGFHRKFAQLYIHDTNKIDNRGRVISNSLDRNILKSL